MTTATAIPARRIVAASPAPLTGRAKTVDAFARAFARATANRIVAYRHLDGEGAWDGSGDVTSASEPGKLYRVAHLGGRDWATLSCTCAGGTHAACQHKAAFAFARAHGVWAVRPAPRCGDCDPTFCPGGCPEAPSEGPVPMRRECLLCGTRLTGAAACLACYPPAADPRAAYVASVARDNARLAAASASRPAYVAPVGVDPLADLWG